MTASESAWPRTGRTVVGFDGSELSRAALAWAARRATPGDRLIAAYAVTTPPQFHTMPHAARQLHATPEVDRILSQAREHARGVLDGIDERIAGDTPIETEVIEGPPARSLADLARDREADEIVVGSRGFGRWRGALGSVSHALLHEADRPVAVITNDAAGVVASRDPTGLIVAGYDGSAGAQAAMRYAIGHLAPNGALTAAYAYEPPPDWLGTDYYQASLDQHMGRGRAALDALLPDLADTFERELVQGHPATAIADLARSRDADAIVVGSRGLGRFAAAIGSVSHALLHEADRPLIVVPRPADEDAEAAGVQELVE